MSPNSQSDAQPKPPVVARPAATLALLRIGADGEAETLMGQRGGAAGFMPSKFVFPGGALDPEDRQLAMAMQIQCPGDPRLALLPLADRDTGAPEAEALDEPTLGLALELAAIRETFEETGLRLGAPDADVAAIEAARRCGGEWAAFVEQQAAPTPQSLGFFFRAITPPRMPRRFDARFFVAPASAVMGDPLDFSRASGELSSLAWTPLSQAASFDLPFITNLVIAELQALAAACAEQAAASDAQKGLGRVAEIARGRPAPMFRHALRPGATVASSRFEAL